ncbi:hypothetical protein [Nocardia miyunensis]|uniref:hypothetical protein n=1 Tax=Nocardia miyunensis TaxID=282684 RepID=UPI00083408CC|nr:hypothetical protein [Nocardia miyunensis]
MTIEFIPVPPDLYRAAEPEAGTVLPPATGRYKRQRPTEQFDPNWEFLLTGHASTTAVVACVTNSWVDVPERVWPEILRLYCPKAWAMLAGAGVSFESWQVGHCPAPLRGQVSATANMELGGYAVFVVMDLPDLEGYLVKAFGQLPHFGF